MVGAWVSSRMGVELHEDRVYKQRLEDGLIKKRERSVGVVKGAKASVWIFLVAVLLVIVYATLISDKVAWIENPSLARNEAIMVLMMSAAAIIILYCKADASEITQQSTFRSGMSAAVCVLGVAWLGDTFVSNHIEEIKSVAGGVLSSHPWLLSVTLFFGSMLLYSQAATAQALMPMALAIGLMPIDLVASFAAVSALFVLPTYPTLLAAIEMDGTGTTRIGKYVINHSFFIPGMATIVSAVAFAYLWARVLM